MHIFYDTSSKTSVHRFMGKARLEEASGVVYANFLLKALSLVRSDQIVQGFNQVEVKNLRVWRLRKFSGQLALLFGCPRGKKVSSCIWSESLVSVSVLSCPPSLHVSEEPGSIFCPKLSWDDMLSYSACL